MGGDPYTHREFPAKAFDTATESDEFAAKLRQLDISYMTEIVTYRKRLNLPTQYVVMIMEVGYGTRH